MRKSSFALLLFAFLFSACTSDEPLMDLMEEEEMPEEVTVRAIFGDRIDMDAPLNYASQDRPAYVRRNNTADNPVSDRGATLGRVLFYDKMLSANETISCASCHHQRLAFGDDLVASTGVASTTSRHGMRLSNAGFGDEDHFFWDKRAITLERQVTQPIRDHIEMGFSGANGDPTFTDLVRRMDASDYYRELFSAVYGDPAITEDRIQRALAQFIRSMESFDAKYDAGRAQVRNDAAPFPNFSASENRGKALFLRRANFGRNGRVGGGLNCGSCHRAPEFGIDPNSNNNGVLAMLNGGQDLTNTRSPSLRDVFLPDGSDNGPFMHNGQFATIDAVIDHYNAIPANNRFLDRRLRPGNRPQRLNITEQERADLIAFLRTLTGKKLFTDARWSDPFVE